MAYAPVVIENPDEDPNKDLSEKDRKTRQEAAVALRVAGANWSEIAETLDYVSPSRARQAVERALADSVGDEDRAQMRHVVNRRLDRLLRATWKKALDEKREDQAVHTRSALAIIDRSIRLNGLDAPSEHVLYSPSALEIDAFIKRAVEEFRGSQPEEVDVVEGDIIEGDILEDE